LFTNTINIFIMEKKLVNLIQTLVLKGYSPEEARDKLGEIFEKVNDELLENPDETFSLMLTGSPKVKSKEVAGTISMRVTSTKMSKISTL